jgi:hypothetical protein
MAAHDMTATWDAFCETLKAAGQELSHSHVPTDEQSQAEGLRYLSRMARAALEWYVEFNDAAFPVLYQPAHETIKLGADNPNNIYQKAVIDGRFDYRLTGKRGSIDYISFATSKGSYAENFKQIETGFIDSNTLSVDSDGYFDLVLSTHEQPGNWLPMDRDSESLLIRQTFLDRTLETAADIQIHRLDTTAVPLPLSKEKISADFEKAMAFYRNTIGLFSKWSQEIRENPNTLLLWDQAFCQAVGGDPNIIYYHGHFRLSAHEVMVITLPQVPECQTWNLQVDNYWMESLDYRYHKIAINRHTAHKNPDGSVDIHMARHDTGHANWLSTGGHIEGTLCFRWVGCNAPIDPTCRVVNRADLAG